MSVLSILNPLTVVIITLIVLAQVIIFSRTRILASRMWALFDISEITITQVSAQPSFRFELAQSANSLSASEMVKVTDFAVRTAQTLPHQLRSLREAVIGVAESFEDRATTIANVPVYLGLVGTFAGIMVGVLQVLLHGGLSETTIQELLAGVFVAMFSSLMGVSLMTASNALLLPRAREIRNERMEKYLLNIEGKVFGLAAAAGEPMARYSQDAQALQIAVRMLKDSSDTLIGSIEAQRRFVDANHQLLAEITTVNRSLASEFPNLFHSVREFEASISQMTHSIAKSASTLQIGELSNVGSIAKDVSALPAMLDVLQKLALTLSRLQSTATSASLAQEEAPPAVSTTVSSDSVARLVCFLVFGIAIACLGVGMLKFPSSHFGAGLSFGGALLAYEAIYVFLRRESQ